jgi:hypothetical protein
MPSQVKRFSWEDLTSKKLHRRVGLPLGPQSINADRTHISVGPKIRIVGIFGHTKLEATQMKGGTKPTASMTFMTLRRLGGFATMLII